MASGGYGLQWCAPLMDRRHYIPWDPRHIMNIPRDSFIPETVREYSVYLELNQAHRKDNMDPKHGPLGGSLWPPCLSLCSLRSILQAIGVQS